MTILAHGPLEQLEPNLWRVEGALPRGPMPRAMAIVRLADGRIVVHSPILLGDAAMTELDALGRVAIVIAPNDHHRLDPAAYKSRYPEARVIAPPGARARIEEKVKVDATAVDLGPGVRYQLLRGTGDGEGYLEIVSGARTSLVLGDLIMNVRPLRGFGGWVMNRMGFTGDAPKIVKPTIKALVRDPAAVRAQLDELAATPNLYRVVVAHGAPFTDAPGDKLRAAGAIRHLDRVTVVMVSRSLGSVRNSAA